MPPLRRQALVLACAFALSGCVAGPSTASVAPRRVVVIEPPVPADCCAALERDVLAELDRARTDPAGYAARLAAELPYYHGALVRRPGDRVALRTREGAAAVREAIGALRSTAPLPPLRRSAGMSAGARDHVRDLGPRGLVEHRGSDGSTFGDRVSRYGRWRAKLSENLSFGPATGRDVVEALLVDDDVPDRGHRRNILDPEVRVAGVACGRHRTYGVMCDIVHATAYEERAEIAARD